MKINSDQSASFDLLSLETDVPQEADARLDNFTASTSPAGAPMFVQTPKQHDEQLVSSTTVNPVQKPQATDENSKVKAWLDHQKANPPIPDMSPMADPSPSPTDAMIGLTYRTNDTIGSSVSLSTFAFDLMKLIHDYSKSLISSPRTCFQLLRGRVAALSRSR